MTRSERLTAILVGVALGAGLTACGNRDSRSGETGVDMQWINMVRMYGDAVLSCCFGVLGLIGLSWFASALKR